MNLEFFSLLDFLPCFADKIDHFDKKKIAFAIQLNMTCIHRPYSLFISEKINLLTARKVNFSIVSA